MKEKNKAIIGAIKNELLKHNGDTEVEILVKFINHGKVEHGVLKYWMNLSGDWMGVMGSMFDFDFFDVREVIGFIKLDNVIDAMYTNGLEFKTE